MDELYLLKLFFPHGWTVLCLILSVGYSIMSTDEIDDDEQKVNQLGAHMFGFLSVFFVWPQLKDAMVNFLHSVFMIDPNLASSFIFQSMEDIVFWVLFFIAIVGMHYLIVFIKTRNTLEQRTAS